MELLLNLAWLLLAIPAFWLWRGSRVAGRKLSTLQCLLALLCTLVILFPVISATDDLCAIRSEVEESPASKRTVRQGSPDKVPGWNSQTQPALSATPLCFIVSDNTWEFFTAPGYGVPAVHPVSHAGRAPPNPFPA